MYEMLGGSLPPGLAFAPGGQITGTPAQVGRFTVVVRGEGADGCAASEAFAILVRGPELHLRPAALPPGQIGSPYAASLLASGGTAPYAFSLMAGSLPPGVVLAANGALSGTPSQAGLFAFRVLTVDALGSRGMVKVKIKVS